jgi:hypothetical protein
MTGKSATYAFVTLLLFLPLRASGNLEPLDQSLASFFDAVLSPIAPAECGFEGPMPRELALRRVVKRTELLLKAEGSSIDHDEMLQIARIVERASLQFHLSPGLIFSVIHSESRFQRNAQSANGALGLMQIQAETARQVAAEGGIPLTSYASLFDPETNILLGTGYLRSLIDQFGDLKTALAAYHVGPTEISRRVSEGESFSDFYGRRVRDREASYSISLAGTSPLGPPPTRG